MKNNQSKEDYLERFLILQEQGFKYIRATDIADSFSFSRASVSIAMKKLIEEGLITCDEHQHLSLTEKGRKIAEEIYLRHKVISTFFISLGVDKDIALEDACKIEHDISEESFKALENFINKEKQI